MDITTLVDQIGQLDFEIKQLEERKKKLLVENPIDVGYYNGNFYKATVYKTQKTLLDSDRVKILLDKEQYDSCLKKSKESTCVRLTKI